MKTNEVLFNLLNQEKETLADEYIRVTEIIDYVQKYFEFNIDDVAYIGDPVGSFTLDQLRGVLDPKITLYKQYTQTSQKGVFAKR